MNFNGKICVYKEGLVCWADSPSAAKTASFGAMESARLEAVPFPD